MPGVAGQVPGLRVHVGQLGGGVRLTMKKAKRPRRALTKRQIRKAAARGAARANELGELLKPSFRLPDSGLILG